MLAVVRSVFTLWQGFLCCVEKGVTVHLVLIKAELGCLETELGCVEAYYFMFLALVQ